MVHMLNATGQGQLILHLLLFELLMFLLFLFVLMMHTLLCVVMLLEELLTCITLPTGVNGISMLV